MTKEKIINNYKKGLMNPKMDMASYNRGMYPSIKKSEIKTEGCRYYLYPVYVDITDMFTSEEIYNNFYIGDLMELDFRGEFAEDKPEDYFSDGWNPITGNGKWGN